MSPRADRALRVHPIVPCPVWYRHGMLEPPPGPAHDESASNRRTDIISCAAATRQSRFHFGMVRVCIHPGHLHPRPPPTDLSYRGSRQRPGSNPRVLDASRLLIHTKSQRHSIVSPAPTDPGPGNATIYQVAASKASKIKVHPGFEWVMVESSGKGTPNARQRTLPAHSWPVLSMDGRRAFLGRNPRHTNRH